MKITPEEKRALTQALRDEVVRQLNANGGWVTPHRCTDEEFDVEGELDLTRLVGVVVEGIR